MTPELSNSTYSQLAGIKLEDVDIKKELASRPNRPPDYEAESRATAQLVQEMAEHPQNILQKLVEVAQDRCRAGSAGLSLLESQHGVSIFRWEALAGVYVAHRNNTMPRNASPCGTTIDRNATQLMHRPERFFPQLKADPPAVEGLLVPFHVGGKPVGTLWIVAHDEQRKFDMEDERLVKTLAKFASAGWQLWRALSAANQSNNELARLTARIENIREEERTRLAREIHDQIGGSLSVLKLDVAALHKRVQHDRTLREKTNNILKEIDGAFATVQHIARELRPSLLDQVGLAEAIESYLEIHCRQVDLACEKEIDPQMNVEGPCATAIFRVFQEAFTNVIRDAKATKITVQLKQDETGVRLVVADNGVGIEQEQMINTDALGIIGMRERLRPFTGTVTFSGRPGGGTTVTAVVPRAFDYPANN